MFRQLRFLHRLSVSHSVSLKNLLSAPTQTQLTMQAGQRAARFHCSRAARVAYTHSIARISSNLSRSFTPARALLPQVRKPPISVFCSQKSESAGQPRRGSEADRPLPSKPISTRTQQAHGQAEPVRHVWALLTQSYKRNKGATS